MRRTRLVLLLSALTGLLVALPALAVPWAWSDTLGAGNGETAYALCQTSDGGFLVAGDTSSFGHGGQDGWVVKLGPSGIAEWQKAYGGATNDSLRSVVALQGGGYLLAGYTLSAGGGSADAWLLKITADGSLVWQNTYGGAGWDQVEGLAQASDGGFVAAGSSQSFGAGDWDVWAFKVDAAGSLQWQKRMGGTGSDGARSVAALTDGGFLVGGYTASYGGGGSDVWAIKLDSAGAVVWQKALGGGGEDSLGGLTTTTDGGAFLACSTQSAGVEAWLVKLTSAGAIEWQKTLGGAGQDMAWSAARCSDGGFLVAGTTYSFGSGAQAWAFKMSSTGTVVWQKAFGGIDEDQFFSCAATSDSGFALAGYTYSSGAGSKDFYLFKLDSAAGLGGDCEGGSNTSATATTASLTATGTSAAAADTAATAAAMVNTGSATAGMDGLCIGQGPLQAIAQADFTTGDAPLFVNFTAKVLGGTAPFQYDWNFGDGSSHSSERDPFHTYFDPGTFTVTLKVTDAASQTSTDSHLSIRVLAGLKAVPQAFPSSGTTPLAVQFFAGVNGGTPPYTITWDFRDGYSSTETDPTHIFVAAGTYQVRVTAVDAASTAVQGTVTVTVGAPGPCQQWASVPPVTSSDLRGVCYGGGQWVGVGGAIVASPDASSWSVQQAGTDLEAVTYGNGLFVAVGKAGKILTSTGSGAWSDHSVTGAQAADLHAVTYGKGLFVAVGTGSIFTSPDGTTWTKEAVSFQGTLRAVVFNAFGFAAVGAPDPGGEAPAYTSADGHAWVYVSTQIYSTLEGLAWNGSKFLAVGHGSQATSGIVMESADGSAWTLVGYPAGYLLDVAWTGGKFVTVGNGGLLWSSSTGATWETQNSGTSSNLNAVALGSSSAVAVGQTGAVVRSVALNLCLTAIPTASPSTGPPPLSVAFDAHASGGRPPYQYDWDFGDGSAHSTEAAPAHTYDASGTYTATVTVTDADSHGIEATLAVTVRSEIWTWVTVLDTTQADWLLSFVPAPGGGYVAAGNTAHVGFYQDGWVVRLSPAGDLIWQESFQGANVDSFQSVIPTRDGGYAVAGYTFNVSVQRQCGVLLKVDGSGNELWQKNYYDTDGEHQFRSVSEASDGGFYLSGRRRYPNADLLLVKVDADGSVLWSKSLGGTFDDEGYNLVSASDGGVIVAGYTLSATPGVQNLWVLKLSAAGDIIWQKTLGTWAQSYLAATPDGGAVLAAGDYFTKLSPNGGAQWRRVYMVETPEGPKPITLGGVARLSDGSFVLTAGTRFLKVDSSGGFQAVRQFYDRSFTSVFPTVDGGFLLTNNTNILKLDAMGFITEDCVAIGNTEILVSDSPIIPENTDASLAPDGLREIPGSLTLTSSNATQTTCVGSGPFTAVAIPDATTGTAPLTVNFVSRVYNGVPPYRYSWSFGDGSGTSAEADPSHIYMASGTFPISLTVIDSLGRSTTSADLVITVGELLRVAPTATPSSGTTPLAVRFAANASGGIPPYSFSWDFKDGSTSTQADPVHLYTETGSYAVSLTVQDSDGKNISGSVTVNVGQGPGCESEWILSATDVYTYGATYGAGLFVVAGQLNNSGGIATSPDGVNWTVRDPGTNSLLAIQYCGGLFIGSTGPNGHLVTSTDGIHWNDIVLPGSAPERFAFRAGLWLGFFNRYLYSSTDGVNWTFVPTAPDMDDTYTAITSGPSGFLLVGNGGQLVSSSADGFTWTAPAPLASASTRGELYWEGTRYAFLASNGVSYYSMDGTQWTPISQVGLEIVFNTIKMPNGYAGLGIAPLNPYETNFYTSPDGLSWTNLGHSDYSSFDASTDLATDGTRVLASTMGSELITDTSSVCLSVAATATPPGGAVPLTTTFKSSVAGGAAPYTSDWDFGDGSAHSTEANPTHTYTTSGEFTATLFVIDADSHGAIATVSIRTAELLTVSAQATPTTGYTPMEVIFTSTVAGGVAPYTYAWTFGDGGTSDLKDPWYTYENPGNFMATLTVRDGSGQTVNAAPISLAVAQGLKAIASGTPLAGTVPLAVHFTGSAIGGTAPYTYSWSFGDGGASSEQNPAHPYGIVGTYQAVLTVTDSLGLSRSSSPLTVHANAPLVIVASAAPTVGSFPLTVQFTAAVSGGMAPYSVAWNFGDGTSGIGESTQHTYSTAGAYPVAATVVDGAGVTATDGHISVAVTPPLTATVTADPTEGMEPLAVRFGAVPGGGMAPYTYTWNFGDGSPTDPRLNPGHTFTQRGTYTVTFTLLDSVGQTLTREISITVTPAQPKMAWRYTADTSLLFMPTVASDGSVYVAGTNEFVYGIGPTGNLLWKKKPGGLVMAPMAFDRGVLYFPTSSKTLVAYSSGGGKAWEIKLGANATSSAAVGPCGDVYIGSTDGYLYAANSGGILKWKFKTAGPIEASPAVGSDGTIYVVSNGGGGGYEATLYAVHSHGGLKWEASTVLESKVTLPLILDGDDNIFVTDINGNLTVVPPTKTTPPPDPRSYLWKGTAGAASPVISQGLLLYSGGGSTKTTKIADGSEGPWTGGSGSDFAPAVSADGKAYVVQNEPDAGCFLVALDMADGSVLSTTKLSGAGTDVALATVNRKGRIAVVAAGYNVECYDVPRGGASGPWVQYGATSHHSARRSAPPTAFITAPANGSQVSGDVNVAYGGTVGQTCDSPKVSFYIEGFKAATSGVSPANFIWFTGASQDGPYTLTAECMDKAGNVVETSVSVTLLNPAPPTYGPLAPIPTFSWQSMADTKFRVYLSTDPNFETILVQSKTSGKPWLKSPGWTPTKGQWDKVMAAAGPTPTRVYWKAIGKTAGLVHLGSFTVTH